MAEILLSLTIIGVVAAITLPSLTGNINERTWNTQRKALYARMSQAIALMPSLNGYGVLEENDPNNVTEVFVTNGLAKVLKINNICDSEHLAGCGIPNKITTLANSNLDDVTTNYKTLAGFNNMFNGSYSDAEISRTYSQIDTKAAAFETANGESILVYYNPNCKPDMQETSWHYSQRKMCANFVYDLNGNKGPNTMGKDIGFIAALYSSDPVIVAPMPLATNAASTKVHSANAMCKEQDEESRAPNRDELTAMFYNRILLGISSGNYWSGTVFSSGDTVRSWTVQFHLGDRGPYDHATVNGFVRCIKR